MSVMRGFSGFLVAVVAVVAAAILSGCGDAGDRGAGDVGVSGPDESSAAAPSEAAGKYDQTWPKPYSETTCGEWLNKMGPKQRFAAAADMLTGARNKGDGGNGVPGDRLVNQFKAAVDDACGTGMSGSLAEAAVGVYLTDRSKYRP